MSPPLITSQNLTCGYGEEPILHDISFSLNTGDFVGVIGPNGCGKSTLVRALTAILKPISGHVTLGNQNISSLSPRDISRQIAVIPQDTAILFGFSVLEMVLMGRTPHLKRLQRSGDHDHSVAERALEQTDMHHLKDRKMTELSGGERQRAIIARALAQEPCLLLLDEPDSHLDIGHQIEIFDLLDHLNRTRDLTLLCVSHNLNLAATYCRQLMLMQEGRILATGSPKETITSQNIKTLYGVNAAIHANPTNGAPQITPYSDHRQDERNT